MNVIMIEIVMIEILMMTCVCTGYTICSTPKWTVEMAATSRSGVQQALLARYSASL